MGRNYDDDIYMQDSLVTSISNCCWKIWKKIGPGFDEIIYKRALELELKYLGIQCQREVRIDVMYDGVLLGYKLLDVFVGGRMIVEAKAVSDISPVHIAQLKSYLKAADLPYGILVNFGTSPLQFRRISKKQVVD